MDFRPPTLQGHEGDSGDDPATHMAKISIQWRKEPALTDVLVNFLSSHPTECRTLFYSDGKKQVPSSAGDHPSGKDKNGVHAAIAKTIFENHLKYGPAYHQNPKRFRDSVANRITE